MEGVTTLAVLDQCGCGPSWSWVYERLPVDDNRSTSSYTGTVRTEPVLQENER